MYASRLHLQDAVKWLVKPCIAKDAKRGSYYSAE